MITDSAGDWGVELHGSRRLQLLNNQIKYCKICTYINYLYGFVQSPFCRPLYYLGLRSLATASVSVEAFERIPH